MALTPPEDGAMQFARAPVGSHATIAGPFIALAAKQWNQYEKEPFANQAECEMAADFWAEDLRRNILNPERWPKGLPQAYIEAQQNYEDTHHGFWCGWAKAPCAW